MGLLLEAVDVGGPLTWRWLLRDAETGNPMADQPVRLDPESDDVVRFRELYGYLDEYAAPDRWTEDGTRFVDLAGKWAGSELLGVAVGAAILNEAPVTVRVTVPSALDEVLLWPLELAHVDGKPLAAQGDVTFLLEKPDGSPDVVLTAELIRLLRPVRRRVRLAVVSACESAADTTAETLRLLGLTEQAQALEAAKPGDQATAPGERPAPQIPGLARALVNSALSCAVSWRASAKRQRCSPVSTRSTPQSPAKRLAALNNQRDHGESRGGIRVPSRSFPFAHR
jgi:hypothetical protein